MTVIAWDGTTLATDSNATDGAAKWQTVKAWYVTDPISGELVILSGAGPVNTILAMREWYKAGAQPDKFPVAQSIAPCHFVVVTKDGLHRYEGGPVPIEHGTSCCAFGEGRDFAYGAFAMWATAKQAVEAANKYSAHCGGNVMEYSLTLSGEK